MSITIPLTKGYTAIVDDEDADLAAFKWQAHIGKTGIVYAMRTKPRDEDGKRHVELMHRVIMARAAGRSLLRKEDVDHWDNIGTNNRRSNLRMATKAQNAANKRANANSAVPYRKAA